MSGRENGFLRANENRTKRGAANNKNKDNGSGEKSPALITGGAGFIGTNLAHRLLSENQPVIIFDNLSRAGVEKNLEWLINTHGDLVQIEIADIRDKEAVERAAARASQVFHFAAQVAVTTSLIDPISDFEINAQGTLYLLEALRARGKDAPPLVFTSTNKVYGALDDIKLEIENNRYQPEDASIQANGIGESRAVEFHSPYGCSKGAADQYVLDYARTFNLPAAVFRMSCIYGEHQFGTEDQGWVAHFLIRALENKPITLYGDGRQVRDILFAEDLIDAFLLARDNIEKISGQAFNIGGGAANSISLLELLDLISDLRGKPCEIEFAGWRPADQRYYVSDARKFQTATGWKPKFKVREGVEKLYRWLIETRADFSTLPAEKQSAKHAGLHETAQTRS